MTTQTAKAEGHYEIDTGNGWKKINKLGVEIIFYHWGISDKEIYSELRAGRLVCTGIAHFRYVEDEPA